MLGKLFVDLLSYSLTTANFVYLTHVDLPQKGPLQHGILNISDQLSIFSL